MYRAGPPSPAHPWPEHQAGLASPACSSPRHHTRPPSPAHPRNCKGPPSPAPPGTRQGGDSLGTPRTKPGQQPWAPLTQTPHEVTTSCAPQALLRDIIPCIFPMHQARPPSPVHSSPRHHMRPPAPACPLPQAPSGATAPQGHNSLQMPGTKRGHHPLCTPHPRHHHPLRVPCPKHGAGPPPRVSLAQAPYEATTPCTPQAPSRDIIP
ncbi:uncharacterized protein LOC128852482 [Cuculus canorus]|uniref:uncharacterized protein LOC128852482 n=1 Tax=Cuculus canorus TaxID=55661 RepID=UPI0023AA3E36|nr:uncharacterized protein LOC128852482 [Cuculus canorus]